MDIVEYTDFLVKSLVDDPELVKVDAFDSDENTKIIEIVVPEDQMKFVIGKGGKNALALRKMVNAYAYIHGMKKVRVNIDAY